MLSRRYSLKASEIKVFFQKRPQFHAVHLSLLFEKGGMGQFPRFAFVISKKIAPRALDRNRVRRRLKSVLFSKLPTLSQGITCIFYGKKGIVGAPQSALSKEIEILLNKAELSQK